MSAPRSRPPEGRYGRRTPESTTRRLRTVGAVLAVAFLGMVGWLGWSYIDEQDVSGELIRYKVVSDDTVEVHLEVRKPKDVTGVCTLRSRSADGDEVGLKDVRVEQRSGVVNTLVELHTTGRATNAELVSCKKAD
ncbi:DUF4307 domain-containing protein [Wenjunlia tyrosinilytica]|uniref:Membrane protein n=1 Tax=Wenjunlia tyrosinilytica TaxID=1544741 RepID=A0A917ZHD1_9ACTN|nr:DUF4307 domain-containing protein [Wenjunlia tyrosinilytica]GGO83031.1 membrane protein [Wenjunlia tyrosinilytica]